MPSVESNTKFKCNGCGAVHDFSNPLDARPCPACGANDWDQLVIVYVCDFCASTNARWKFPCASFTMPRIHPSLPAQNSYGDWTACDACKELVSRSAWSELLDRVMQVDPSMDPHDQILRGYLAALYRTFAAKQTGPPTLDEQGDPSGPAPEQ